MRRISIPLFIIAILLCAIISPSPAKSCDWSEGTVLDHVERLFYWHTTSWDYPVHITKYWGWWDSYALGFSLEPHATNPDVYWITFYIRDYNHWNPLHSISQDSTYRECYSKSRTTDWPWPYEDYGPYPGYPLIDPPRNLGKPQCPVSAGNPINLDTGNKFQQEADFSIKTPGPELGFRRSYNSQSNYNGPLGYGWTHNYNLFIEDQGNRVVVWDADGKALYFEKEGGGNFTADVLVYDTLTQEEGGAGDYVLTRKNNTICRFSSQGRLQSIKDLNDNQITLTYSGTLLTGVSNNFGKEITFTYRQNSKIETVSDPKENTYTFTYTGDNLTGMTAPDGVLTKYLYEDPNDPHNMTQKRIAGQTVGTWGYDEHDRATQSSKAGGVEAISLTYEGTGMPDALQVSVSDSRGYERIYRFWSLYGIPRVIGIEGSGCSSCSGTNMAYDYDKDTFALTRVIDRNSNITDFTWDLRGNILTKKEASGTLLERTTSYTYHSTFNLVETITIESVANPGQDKVTRFSYNPKGHLSTKTVSGYIGTTQYEYTTTYDHNSFGQLTLVDGPRTDVSDITTYTYDPVTGNLLSMTQPHVRTTYYSGYDQNGNLGAVTDPNRMVTTYTYDARNRIETVTKAGDASTLADDSTTQYYYDSLGNMDYIVLPEGNTINYTYDSAGRFTRVEDDLGNAIIYTYDTESNKIREEIQDPEGTLKKYLDFEYDEDNRLWKIINPDTTFTEFDYDGNGNRIWMKDPRGNTADYKYDELNRLTVATQRVDLYELNTTYSYDAHDNFRSVEDANLNVTSYTYDDFARVTEITSPDTGTTIYRHDEAGNLIEKTDAERVTATYNNDALNRLTHIGFPDPSQDITYSYDSPSVSYGKGRLTGMADPTGTYSYQYDLKGNLKKEEKLIAGITYVTEYAYNKNDTLTSITYPSRRIVAYGLDTVGRIYQVTTTLSGTPKTVAFDLDYLPYGGITELTYGNGLVRTQGYDLQYRTTSIQAGSVLNFGFDDDANGNITSITDYLDQARSQGFVYDELNRLESASGIYGQINYTYDFVGNRKTKTVDGQTDTYIYEPNTNKLDEITGANPMDFGHDPNGNIVTMGSKTFTYNQNNRLFQATEPGLTLGEYGFNGMGQRIKKVTDGATTIYHYSKFGNLIAESDDGGTFKVDYLYLNGQPLAILDISPEEAIYYYHQDHLGTPQVLTDGQGQVVWKANFKPFGEVNIVTDEVRNNFRFPGQYFDQETGLHYNYYRYYDSGIGRYVEPEPLGQLLYANLYPYSLQNPLAYYDPDALEVVSIVTGGTVVAGGTATAALAGVGVVGVGIGTYWVASELGAEELGEWLGVKLYDILHPPLKPDACEFGRGKSDKYGPLWKAPGMPGYTHPSDLEPGDPHFWDKPSNWNRMTRWEKIKWYAYKIGKTISWNIPR